MGLYTGVRNTEVPKRAGSADLFSSGSGRKPLLPV